MVSLSGLLRFWQEFRTNKAAQALKSMVRTTATVLRRGREYESVKMEIAIEELVPGDIIFLAGAIWCLRMCACWSPGTCLSASRFLPANLYRWKNMT
jgi:hypothetical protein